MPSRGRSLVWPILVYLVIVAGGYAAVRFKRTELVDLAAPKRAAERFLAHETMYRAEDGHYQFKYLPAFAPLVVPFLWVSKDVGEVTWFALMVAMIWAFVSLSLAALPGRRRSAQLLVWLTLLLTGKFLVKELVMGQFNLPLALLLIGAVIAAQRGKGLAAGALVAAGVFIKPYALIMVPWLAWTLGWRPFVTFGLVLVAGLLLPAVSYGWDGNVALLQDWYRTVTDTTAPNLWTAENISFASMWAKWIGAGPAAKGLALASAVVAVGAGLLLMSRRRRVAEPNYLEGAYFFMLVPLLSPQGWDYVLLVGIPAYMCLVDRWHDLSPAWRATAAVGFFLTSFTIFDLLGRTFYAFLMRWDAVSLGAVLLVACLINLRWRALA
ncbi:MAG TPA: glycosyltransferase family 87 protein [Vicinamibacterales bacterium]|nr:glycosyltransferase family 87 protein [Vicinamibacterales bacterium]